MVHNPDAIGTFEFIILSSLRAAQLMRGCTPRVPEGHKRTVTAQLEVASGAVVRAPATTGTPA
jgi:hypothetical protein